MRNYCYFFSIVWIILSCQGNRPSVLSTGDNCIFQPRDREIADEVFKQFAADRKLETGELMVKVARFFINSPYVANTLEKGDSEKLVINLREFDCTTLTESCLALSRTIQMRNPDFSAFTNQLERIRYRNGVRNGYSSRLHYFSDWIFDNERKEIVKNVSHEIAHTLVPNQVNFMSTHPENYVALKNNATMKEEIARQEVEIGKRMTWFIPENKVAELENRLLDGDIIGIVTNIEGLDISHVVIACRHNGRIGFIHAGSKDQKVVVSQETLEEYLFKGKLSSGIMVARPL